MVAVSQGITPAGLNAKPVFPVKASKKEIVSFVLKERNEASLERKVNAGIYSHFLTVRQFANSYGQTGSKIRALEKYLRKFHLKVTSYADGIDVTATGTAGAFNHALSVSQSVFRTAAVPAGDGRAARPAVTFDATRDKPLLPKSIASYVEAVLGLDNYPVDASNALHVKTAKPTPRQARKAQATKKAQPGVTTYYGDLTPAFFESQYGLSGLGTAAQGQGQTLGIITLAAMHPSDAYHFWSADLGITTKANRIKLDNVDGGAKFGAKYDSQESTLDVEQSGGVAPQASIIVYQAPNTDYGVIDAYAAAASQNKAGSVSSSWGESETLLTAEARAGYETPTLIQANDEFFLELAAQGQSSFTASGDEGAYAATEDLGSTNLSVQSTSDSPWTTAAGATTLPGTIPLSGGAVNVSIAAERAWGWDWAWPYYKQFDQPNGKPYTSEAPFAVSYVTGSTGGYSTAEARPGYQQQIKGIGSFHAVPYLKPADFERTFGTALKEPYAWYVWDSTSKSATAPNVISGTARTGRAVPDLATNGDPYTGYELYYGGLQDGWGGTSFVAPQLNGSAAVIDAYLGHRVGFWNPAIYKFAASGSSPFTPLDATGASNDNIFYTGTAGALYNPATGLGTPDLQTLATDFAGL
jgi:kumamolisin